MPTDRHGRAARVDGDPRRRPSDGYRLRGADRFRRVVSDAVATLPDRFVTALGGARLVVEDVPPPPMTNSAGEVTLAAFDGSVLTVYRRPVEIRAESPGTLEETIIVAVGQAVARWFGWDDDVEGLLD
jgi:predicted Zn-dependent protease with MMP-like domain